jgi:hypothetical protein
MKQSLVRASLRRRIWNLLIQNNALENGLDVRVGNSTDVLLIFGESKVL